MSSTLERRKNFKREYEAFYKALTMLLAEYDPMNLMFEDMPYDEYDIEVAEILLRLNEIGSPDIFEQVIYDTFVHCFGQHLLYQASHLPREQESNLPQ